MFLQLALTCVVLLIFILKSSSSEKYLSNDLIRIYHELLTLNSDYYRGLSPKGKKRFVQRLNNFRNIKKFVGKNGFIVKEEHETLISAAAIQISFGLDNYLFRRFPTIVIFPDVFRIGSHEQLYKGITGPYGEIGLSWKHFVEGYSTVSDKLNLGIHEMSHALEINAFWSSETTMDFALKYDKLKGCSREEFNRLQNDENSFLRAYAGASEHEFFAVCLENFFEAPQEFSENLPEIFSCLSILLNQDPRNTGLDYSLK
jgi:Mlc titration factor MtfA (ptsG expression regulator)